MSGFDQHVFVHDTCCGHIPAIACRYDEVFPPRMLAYERNRICSIRAPTQCSVIKLFAVEPREIYVDSSTYALFRRIRVRVRWMLRMRARHRDPFSSIRAIRLVLFEPGESRELITNLDYAVLIWLEEESDVPVVHHRTILDLGSFLGRKSEVCIHPSLVSSQHFQLSHR